MIDIKTFVESAPAVFCEGSLPQGSFKISTDSRKYQHTEVFVALVGENFDGFDYVEPVLQKICPLVVFSATEENIAKAKNYNKKYPGTCFYGVKDTIQFLQTVTSEHAVRWRNESDKRLVIGITGSNGKTTTKEMLYHLLDHVIPGKVMCTQGNFNNHIGVPLTLSQIHQQLEIAIVEMGSNHPGEIGFLCGLAKPDAGMITNVGRSHLEFFETEENVFKEKSSLYHAIKTGGSRSGLFILNADDKFLSGLERFDGVVSFGRANADALIDFKGEHVSIDWNGNRYNLECDNIHEEYNFYNLSSCFLLAASLFPDRMNDLITAAKSFRPSNNRSEWVEIDDKKFFLDAYNANPSSMEASLRSFVNYCGHNKIPLGECAFILGDMNELGDNASAEHRIIGKLLQGLQIENVLFVGRYCEDYFSGFQKDAKRFSTKDELNSCWEEIKKQHRYFFIKGSRTLQLESLVDIKSI